MELFVYIHQVSFAKVQVKMRLYLHIENGIDYCGIKRALKQNCPFWALQKVKKDLSDQHA